MILGRSFNGSADEQEEEALAKLIEKVYNERKQCLILIQLKALVHLDFCLEVLVSSLWLCVEREYDISAVYAHHSLVRSIPSQYSKIAQNHLPKTDKTSLHTAVNMWIRNLVIRNHVGDLQLGIESYQTKINLERPNWDAADYYFKEDYTIVPKPRAVVYRDRNDQRKLMRLNELHKFSDGTLTRVMEKLDQMVKDFHLYEYNKGMETRKWSEDDKREGRQSLSSKQSRKDYRSEGSIEV
ncbi:hypothetical protein Tco_1113035 [Tanacetum coccineum]|uniref:Uncharacterized protein n=1 Tax=Tanacetum coccineum TaxID=301880 RepID=A0ABQ5IQZ4_9ASTR